ncbi:MAG: response regulator [Bacteroidia bacterium]
MFVRLLPIMTLPKLQSQIHVLYVDIEPQKLTLFRNSFSSVFKVSLCSDATEASEIINSSKVDVLISNDCLPNDSGVQLLENVMQYHPEVGRILITNSKDVESVIDAVQRSKVFRFLTKPWKKSELIKTIRASFEFSQRKIFARSAYC